MQRREDGGQPGGLGVELLDELLVLERGVAAVEGAEGGVVQGAEGAGLDGGELQVELLWEDKERGEMKKEECSEKGE